MTKVTLAKLDRASKSLDGQVSFETYEVDGKLSPSGRWVLFSYIKPHTKKKFWAVAHTITGYDIPRGDMNRTQALHRMNAIEDVPTPHLDALRFGELGSADDAKSDLKKLRVVLSEISVEERDERSKEIRSEAN